MNSTKILTKKQKSTKNPQLNRENTRKNNLEEKVFLEFFYELQRIKMKMITKRTAKI